jgi:hypothetical protein
MTTLKSHFQGVSAKLLSAVETAKRLSPAEKKAIRAEGKSQPSHQHEFNGTAAMRGYLGTERRQIETRFIYLGVDDDRLSVESTVTWYDAREKHETRTEYRLYFSNNEVMERASEGDVLIAALGADNTLLLIIVSDESELLRQVLWLFGLGEITGTSFVTIDTTNADEKSDSIFSYIAEEIGLELEEQDNDQWLGFILQRFGANFPKTRELSALALETLENDICALEEPDKALLSLMDREEAMFRQLERYIVRQHLSEHASSWADDVDAFVKFSLSVQNRRKSRAGHALENHLEWAFQQRSIRFERGVRTESHSKPDFLFPGQAQYLDESFPSNHLTMLGVKTSCKDRWRQVLNEAKRIQNKHLLTLQPAISEHQTDEMAAANLTLVLPEPLHKSYSEKQTRQLLTLSQFIEVIESRQQK